MGMIPLEFYESLLLKTCKQDREPSNSHLCHLALLWFLPPVVLAPGGPCLLCFLPFMANCLLGCLLFVSGFRGPFEIRGQRPPISFFFPQWLQRLHDRTTVPCFATDRGASPLRALPVSVFSSFMIFALCLRLFVSTPA